MNKQKDTRYTSRIAAYAETGWTRKEDKNFQDFRRRLTGYEKILDAQGTRHGEKE